MARLRTLPGYLDRPKPVTASAITANPYLTSVTSPAGGFWVGAPGEGLAGVRDTGMVHKLAMSTTSFRSFGSISQNSPLVAGANEPGDNFGASLESGKYNEHCYNQVAIGVPGEDRGAVKDAGVVRTYQSVNEVGEGCFTTSSHGPDARAGDRFGAALSRHNASGDFFYSGLIIGIPGQDLGSYHDVGAVRGPGGMSNLSRGSLPGIRYGSVIADYALNYY